MQFESYVQQHARALMRLATVLADDPATAEDVLQEVLLRAHQRWPVIAATDRPHAYVRRMVVNESISWRRRWGRIEPRPDRDLDRVQADATGVSDTRDELLRAVVELPPRQRAAVVLRYFEDLDDGEIAAVLGCRAGTVRGYLHRALKNLNMLIPDAPASHSAALRGSTP